MHLIYRILILFLSFPLASMAQKGSLSGEKVDAASVPPAVVETLQAKFAGQTPFEWRKQTAVGEKLSVVHYIAVLKNQGLVTRVRITETGNAVGATTFYGPWKAPQVARDVAAKNAGYKLLACQKVLLYKNNQTYYRVSLGKGGEKKLIFCNEQGAVLSNEEVSKGLQELMSEPAE